MTGFLLDHPGVRLGVRAMVVLIVAFLALGVPGLLEADVRTEVQRNLGMLVIFISTALCIARPVAVARKRAA